MKAKEIAQEILNQINTMSPNFLSTINGSSFLVIPENNREFNLKTAIKDIHFKLPDKFHYGGLLFTAIYSKPIIISITLNCLDLYDVAVHDVIENETDISEDIYFDTLIDVMVMKLEKIIVNQMIEMPVKKEVIA